MLGLMWGGVPPVAAQPWWCFLPVLCPPGLPLLLTSIQVLPCNDRPCPVDCRWDHWSLWSPCTGRSGGECSQGRSRGVERQVAQGGLPCHGENAEQRNCQSPTCLGEFIPGYTLCTTTQGSRDRWAMQA